MAKIIYKNHLPGPVYIAESVKSKKVAGTKVVNESVDEDADGEDKKYVGSAYYDAEFRGLADSIETDDWDEFTEWIHDQSMKGSFLDLDNNEEGTYLKLSPERYIELCGDEDGEIVGDIEPSMFEKCDTLDYMQRPASKRISDSPEDAGDDEVVDKNVEEDTENMNERKFTGTIDDKPVAKNEGCPSEIVAIYDSPDFWDRYTVVYGSPFKKNGEDFYECLGLSENPNHPQGFSQWSECMMGDHLGKSIEWDELPDNVKDHIRSRFSEATNEAEDDEGEEDVVTNDQVAKEFDEFIGNREACVETKEGVIYFQYNKEDNMLEYGGATNTGLIKDGALEYDKSNSMQSNIENLISEIETKYGTNVEESVREATNKLIEMLDDGALDEETVAMACLKYMSEDDVKDMAESNELYNEEEDKGDTSESRHVTNYLLDLAEEGVLTYSTIIDAATDYMSEDDVKDMAEANEFFYDEEEEEDEDAE